MATEPNLAFLRERGQSLLVGTPRFGLNAYDAKLCTRDWQRIREHVAVKTVLQDGQTHVLARSWQRRAKERVIRLRQLLRLHDDLEALAGRVAGGSRTRKNNVSDGWLGSGDGLPVRRDRSYA